MEPEMTAQLSEARALLRTAYPGRRIVAHVVVSDDPVPFRTFEVEDRNALDLSDVEVHSVVEFGDAASVREPVEVVVTIARSSTAQASKGATPVVGRPVRLMVALSPMLFESIKYKLDQRHETKLFGTQLEELPEREPEETLSAEAAHALRAEGQAKRPAILIGFHWLEHGGAEKLAFDTVAWALAAGLRVIVVAAHNGLHRLANRLPDSQDVTFARMDRYVPQVRTREFLRNLALQENVQAIQIHHCPPLFDALPAIRSMSPNIHVISSTHIVEYKGGGYVFNSAKFGEYIDTQHVISRQLGEVLREQLGSSDGIRLGRILENKPVPAGSLNFPSSLANRPLRVIFVGRMSYQKRPVLVAMIMRSLASWSKSKGIQLTFDVVGEGPYLPVFKRLLRRFKLTEMSTLHAASTHVPKLMAQADILLLPSANEGLALVCYEAVQAGTIPISSDVGAQSELVPPQLLVDRNPRTALRSVTDIVDRLVGDAQFYRSAVDGLVTRYEQVTADTTAHEALSEIYDRVAALGDNHEQP